MSGDTADCEKKKDDLLGVAERVAGYNPLTAEQGRALYAAYVKRGLELQSYQAYLKEPFDGCGGSLFRNGAFRKHTTVTNEWYNAVKKVLSAPACNQSGIQNTANVPASCATCGKTIHKTVFCSQGCAYSAGYYLIGKSEEDERCYDCSGSGIDPHDNDPMGRSMNQPCFACKGTGKKQAAPPDNSLQTTVNTERKS